MRKMRKVLFFVLAICLAMGSMNTLVFADSSDAAEDFDVYVLNYSNEDIAGYEDWDNKRLYASPYRTDIYVTNKSGNIEHWNWCSASVLNMIHTAKLSESGEGAYASIPVYCVDAFTDGNTGHQYRRINLEDSGYFSDEIAGKLRSIMLKVFPYQTDMSAITAEVNAWIDAQDNSSLKTVENLNYAEVISAAQSVIWTLTNEGRLHDIGENGEGIYAGYSPGSFAGQIVYPECMEFPVSGNTPTNITSVTSYLNSLAPTAPSTPLISDASFDHASVNFELQPDGTYTAYIKVDVTANVYGETELNLYAVSDDQVMEDGISVADGTNTYEMAVPGFSAPEDITLKIEGVQTASDVFLFDPLNGRDASQSMAGYDDSTLPVQAKMTIEADDEEKTTTSTFVTVEKAWIADEDAVRPDAVQIQLLKDDIAYGTPVTLTAENNWSYKWSNLDPDPEILWTVKEIDVPEGYTAVVTGEKNVFTITNTYTPPEEPVLPEEPVVPEEPVLPEEPVVPEEPVLPEEPVVPEESVLPVEPVAPEEPVLPVEPVMPEESVLPVEPVASEEPKAEVPEKTIMEEAKPEKAPDTADVSSVGLYLFIVTASIGALMIMVKNRRN